jgi:predicted phage-related endonuclease
MTPAMERGILLEPIAIDLLRKQHPDWDIQSPGTYYRDSDIRLGATPDVIAVNERGRAVIQIKSVEPRKFNEEWKSDSDLVPPPYAAIQALVEAHLTGASWAMVAALVVSHGIELHLVEVPFHSGVIMRILAETVAFWKMVEEGREPEPDYGRDAELIGRLYAAPTEQEIDLTTDNALPATVADWRDIGGRVKELEDQRKALAAEILHKLGDATSARIATGVISAKVVNRAEHVVKASSFRQIRFRENPA